MNNTKNIAQLRIGTINVHFFTDSQGQPNVHRIAQLIKPMSFDLLAMQEVLRTDHPSTDTSEDGENFLLLSDLLELPYTDFCHTSQGFGNGVLSRIPLKNSAKYRTEKVGDHNARGMLAVQLDHEFFSDNNATLYVTHLDQLSEQIRLNQMNQFEKHVHDEGLQMILGDFNSLTFEDYSDDYFNANIHDVRQQNAWEAPCNLLTNRMKTNGYRDCWREMNKEALNDQAITCIYKTRIDYIWRRGELNNGWIMSECKIFPSEDATDHNGVLVTFTKSLTNH
ncbi:unnamed protein product, partial [Rotaria magnacalcarata]